MKIIMDPRRIVAVALFAALASGCAAIDKYTKPPAPPEPPLILDRDEEFTVTCTDVFVTELDRPREQPWGPGDNGLEACLDLARSGYTKKMLTEWARSSPEYPLVLERRDAAAREAEEQRKREEREAEERRKREEEERARRGKFRGRLRAEGQRIVDAEGQPFVEPFASSLTLLTKSPAERAAVLDELVALGFRGVRVFAGALTWAPQTPGEALRALPAVLQETRDRNLYLLVTALTDTREGNYHRGLQIVGLSVDGYEVDFEIEDHVRSVASLAAQFPHAVVEIANEPYHPSQRPLVNDFGWLCAMAQRVMAGYTGLWALGAAPADHPINGRYPTACGPVSTSHVERTSPDDQLARVVGLAQIAEATNRPVISGELIGAAEVTKPGSRLADPEFFGKMAHRQASLGITGVFHSEDGLYARPLGNVQKEAARQFVAGYAKPPIDIHVPPLSACSQARDDDGNVTGDAIVRCRRAAWGAMSRADILTFLRDVASDLNVAGLDGAPFGVLVKPDGNNCHGYSCDILCSGNGSTQRQWDVLGDVGVTNAPTFSELPRDEITVRPCEPLTERLESGPPWPEGSLGTMPLPAIVSMKGKGR